MPDPQLVAMLDAGTHRLVRSVDAIGDELWARPSLLPGWSRAHVVAHLTLNAEALAGVLAGVREGNAVAMYESDAVRDWAIEDLAATDVPDLRDRFLASTTVIGEAVRSLAEDLADTAVERTPGGRSFPAGDVGWMRTREVEIHHADLDLGYGAADWQPPFAVVLLAWRAQQYDGPGFVAHATDLDQSWTFGDGGPTVDGPASALAWWVTGRPVEQTPGGDGLTSDDGPVPRMEPW